MLSSQSVIPIVTLFSALSEESAEQPAEKRIPTTSAKISAQDFLPAFINHLIFLPAFINHLLANVVATGQPRIGQGHFRDYSPEYKVPLISMSPYWALTLERHASRSSRHSSNSSLLCSAARLCSSRGSSDRLKTSSG